MEASCSIQLESYYQNYAGLLSAVDKAVSHQPQKLEHCAIAYCQHSLPNSSSPASLVTAAAQHPMYQVTNPANPHTLYKFVKIMGVFSKYHWAIFNYRGGLTGSTTMEKLRQIKGKFIESNASWNMFEPLQYTRLHLAYLSFLRPTLAFLKIKFALGLYTRE